MPTPTFLEKRYQQEAIERFDDYLAALKTKRVSYDQIMELRRQNPGLDIPFPHFPQEAWAMIRTGRVKLYSQRTTGAGLPCPNCTLKVPTGGGKTYLATAAVARLVTTYFTEDRSPFVLWIMPSEAIYEQTKRQLSDREHPYRQLLDRISGNRVKILEKGSRLSKPDLEGCLTIMLLMLPSANRQSQETLKLFQDSGNVTGFFPEDIDVPANQALVAAVPNLTYRRQGELGYGDSDRVASVEHSVGNALRLIRPIVVMDEGQKAFGELAHRTLYGLNPRFVVELSATPRDARDNTRHSNWLTDIRGTDLHAEEMIKMPLNLYFEPDTNWRTCLRKAWEKTEDLQTAADRLGENEPRYVRPILLVQVERTGKDTRGGDEVHALDAKEALMAIGVPAEAIRLKTAETNELEGVDLLARDCPVRAVITKSALQEGWDCPFAYVLCSLLPQRSVASVTQMIGRILRQPDARKTGVEALDQCYAFTPHPSTNTVIKAIKDGLEGEGMGDLVGLVRSGENSAAATVVRERRAEYRGDDIFLPQVMVWRDGSLDELDWETDILSAVEWRDFDISAGAVNLPIQFDDMGQGVTVIGADGSSRMQTVSSGAVDYDKFNFTYAVRVLMEFIPNPFIAAKVIKEFRAKLAPDWTEQAQIDCQRYLTDKMRELAKAENEKVCKAAFIRLLTEGKIEFNLRTSSSGWMVPQTVTTPVEPLAVRSDGHPMQSSLFENVPESEVGNGLEFEVVSYLDADKMVDWWYRNVARMDYGLQGWRKNRVYPDFVVARTKDAERRISVLETKGDHLAGNLDSEYKREFMHQLEVAYTAQREWEPIGELNIEDRDFSMTLRMVMQSNWRTELASALA